MTAEEVRRGRCLDCGHPEHEMTCHETVGGDPSNGPAYCPCVSQIENMEREIVRLRAEAARLENARLAEWVTLARAWANVMDGRRIGEGLSAARVGGDTTTGEDWRAIGAEYDRLREESGAAVSDPLLDDPDVRAVVNGSSTWQNCRYKTSVRSECADRLPGRQEEWCSFCRAYPRVRDRLDRVVGLTLTEPRRR